MNLRPYLIFLTLVASSAGAQGNAARDNLLGAAVRNRPHYEGSDRQTTNMVPPVRYSHGIWLARTLPGILDGRARFSVAEASS